MSSLRFVIAGGELAVWPEDIVGVATHSETSVLLLLRGGHQIPVAGTFAIVRERWDMARIPPSHRPTISVSTPPEVATGNVAAASRRSRYRNAPPGHDDDEGPPSDQDLGEQL